jgi:hypothetical protein
MVIHNTTRTSTAIADSGCTGHFLQVDSPCLNKTPTSNGLCVLLPHGSTIQATHTALLDLPNLLIAARQAHIILQLKHNALISIAQFCDPGCTAVFTSTSVQILVDSKIIIQGSRQPATGLWTINLQKQTTPPSSNERILDHAANSVYKMETKSDLMNYLHKCCYSPTTSGWLKAIKNGFFTTWPGLSNNLVQKHVTKSAATIKGHQQQQFKNIRSTSKDQENTHADGLLATASNVAQQQATLVYFSQESTIKTTTQTNMIYVKAIETTGQICTDQTSRFLTTSS